MTYERPHSIQELREQLIRTISESEDANLFVDPLFNLGLTMYARNLNLKSVVYNAFSLSELDENISLHPEQLKVLDLINKSDGLILSAPTSFGKTFAIFEYIARNKPDNIALVVPTLALVEEYNRNIIKKYEHVFSEYKVHLFVDEQTEYDFSGKNIFIITHERIVDKSCYMAIKKLDFLVIDEVYKLETDKDNERVLVLNLAYYHLAKLTKKYVLLGPFIDGIENIEALEKKPHFYKTDYSPVVNEVKTYDILNENQRHKKTLDILKNIGNSEDIMIYVPTVSEISKFVNKNDITIEHVELNETVSQFIKWVEKEIHEEWYLIKAMRSGYLVHNGKLPMGIRMYQLYLYNNRISGFSKLLCTSTLLEGVNTNASNIIITRPSRLAKRYPNFGAFDFYNLVGRAGRLNKHYIGYAHYIKGPTDLEYNKTDAIKKIKFELTDKESTDINIHKDEYENSTEYLSLLANLGITHKEYKENLGRFRISKVLELYENYTDNKAELFKELETLLKNKNTTLLNTIKALQKTFSGKDNKIEANIIKLLLDKSRLSVHDVVTEVSRIFSQMAANNLDYLINLIINYKSSLIEHDFYAKLNAILYFMECEHINQKILDVLIERVIANVNYLYFIDSKQKRMLKDLGVYEGDIEKIISVIGENFDDVFEMKRLLIINKEKIQNVGFISRFILRNLIE